MALRLGQGKIEAQLAFLFTVTYIPYITGAATNSRWCLASIVFPVCIVLLYRPFRFNWIIWIGLLFLLYAGITLNWSYTEQAYYEYFKFIILMEAFVIGYYLKNLKSIFLGLSLGIGVSSVLVLIGFKGGLFINVNTLAELSVIILVGLCIYRLWWYIPLVLPAIVANGSRGAILTLGLVFSIWCWSRAKTISILIWIGIILTLLSGYRNETITDRLNIWNVLLNSFHYYSTIILGNGFANFNSWGYYNINSRPMFAHNDLLQILFDMGLIGVILISSFFILLMRQAKNERYIVGTFLIIAMFDFPLYLPVSSCVALLTCGYLAHNGNNVFLQNT